ncbi:response regulator [Paenibacillus tarimensis]
MMDRARRWKVLIADDEAIIREGIRSSLEWETLGLCLSGEAEDGEEALELGLQHRVDILLVDLNMPIMNGMELIEQIREELPACRIVIITGHDEFAYAQEAIRLKVDDYILKPVNPGQLNEVLRKTVVSLQTTLADETYLQLASRQIDKNFSLLRERFCLEWIGGELSEEEIIGQLAFLRLSENAPAAIAVVRWPEMIRGNEILAEKDRQLYLFAIENIVEELLQPYPSVHFRDHSGLIVVLLWETPGDEEFGQAEEAVRRYLKISVKAVQLRNTGSFDDIPQLYLTAKSAVFMETRLSPLVRQAKQIIETVYPDSGLSLEGAAKQLNVSAVYLSRLFKQELGISFIGLLTQTRVKAAIALLNDTDLSMCEIAERVGYESQHYFSTSFKKMIGVPPNQYRKSVPSGR